MSPRSNQYPEAIKITLIGSNGFNVALNVKVSSPCKQELRSKGLTLPLHSVCNLLTACFGNPGIINHLVSNRYLPSELLLLKHQNSVFCAGKIERGGKPRRTAAYDDHVIKSFLIIISDSIH